jgi:diguanylate cyclase (GGDEF)-like protein/PAS domain S-box-containing protein
MKQISLSENNQLFADTTKFIGNTPYFRTVEFELLKEVFLKAWIYELEEEEYLIRETKKSDHTVYILISGEFDVFASGRFILKIDQPGQTIGEMAVVSRNTPRSADVVATSKSRVVAIDSSFLDDDDPDNSRLANSFLKMFSNILAEKLRITTDRAKLYENAVLEKQEIDKYHKEITDISKDLKKELQQKLGQIKLFSQVVESNHDAIITSDADGNLLTGNAAFQTLFGYQADEITDHGLKALFSELVIEGPLRKEIIEKGWNGQTKAKRKNDTTFPTTISISPVRTKSEEGKEKTVLATVVRDISLQKKYEENILKANKELKQTYNELENTLKALENSNQIKDRFLSNISSQLKTPLDSLINYAELMKKYSVKDALTTDQTDLLSQVMEEGNKMEKLVGNLITMSELTSEFSLSMEVVNFESLIEEFTSLTKSIRNLNIEIDPEITLITADRPKIIKALLEIVEYLVSNRQSEEPIFFKCKRDREKSLLVITISLNEPMLSEDIGINDLDNLADGIELTIQKGELELPLVKRIIELHQGEMLVSVDKNEEHILLKLPLDPSVETGSRINVMIIDEHEWDRRIIKGIIEKQFALNEIYEFDSQIASLNAINALNLNLVIVDPFFSDPQWDYEDFLKRVLACNQKKISTLVISDKLLDLDLRNRIISLGITDFLFKPFTIEDALFKINSIIETEQKFFLLSNNIQKAQKSAATDGMTGLFNRKYFDNFVKEQLIKAELQGGNCSLIMLDVDNFKHYNDTNGHQLGDEVLKKAAKILQTSIRQSDMVARYGGEEFVVVLPGTAKKMAEAIAEKLRLIIETTEFENEGSQPQGKLTASFGVSSFPENGNDPETLLKGADHCLYIAKEQGRNKVVGAEGIINVSQQVF